MKNIKQLNREAIKNLKKQNKKYPKFLIEVDEKDWPYSSNDIKPDKVWRSRYFLVQMFNGDQVRLTVNRTMIDRDGHWIGKIRWEELQEIKKQCGFGMLCAVEIYPPEKSIINVANMRHLWILNKAPSFMWEK